MMISGVLNTLHTAQGSSSDGPQLISAVLLLSPGSAPSNVVSVCVTQIVGNGSEQQLQRELEDVLMDPSVADADLEMDHPGLPPAMASPVEQGSDPLTSDPLTPPPSKLEIVLPVQTAQESELNERSYRGEPASPSLSPEPQK